MLDLLNGTNLAVPNRLSLEDLVGIVVAGAVSEAFPNLADRLATLFDFDGLLLQD